MTPDGTELIIDLDQAEALLQSLDRLGERLDNENESIRADLKMMQEAWRDELGEEFGSAVSKLCTINDEALEFLASEYMKLKDYVERMGNINKRG